MFWIYADTNQAFKGRGAGVYREDILPSLKVFITLSMVVIDKHLLNILEFLLLSL